MPRLKLIQADALSCRSDHITEEDDETIVMLPDDLFISLIATNLKDKIATATGTDELATKIKSCLHEQLPPPMRTALSNWSFKDDLIVYKGKVYVPADTEL